MSLPIYPGRDLVPGLSYGQEWEPNFYNLPTATTGTGADIDLAVAQYPLHDFDLEYEFIRHGLGWPGTNRGLEFPTMMGFFLQIGGTAGRFLYKNIDDCKVSRNKIGVGDGSTTVFTLTRTFGANGYFGTEPVGRVNQGALFDVYLNGSASPVLPSAYTVDTTTPCANTVTFTTAPPNGQKIEVDMSYYYYCKFKDNSNSFKKFMNKLWSMDKVSLHSCRPGA